MSEKEGNFCKPRRAEDPEPEKPVTSASAPDTSRAQLPRREKTPVISEKEEKEKSGQETARRKRQ